MELTINQTRKPQEGKQGQFSIKQDGRYIGSVYDNSMIDFGTNTYVFMATLRQDELTARGDRGDYLTSPNLHSDDLPTLLTEIRQWAEAREAEIICRWINQNSMLEEIPAPEFESEFECYSARVLIGSEGSFRMILSAEQVAKMLSVYATGVSKHVGQLVDVRGLMEDGREQWVEWRAYRYRKGIIHLETHSRGIVMTVHGCGAEFESWER